MFLGWYDVVTSDNVKSTLRQRCVFQCCSTYNVEQRRVNAVYFNVDINNVRQRRNNIVNFNVEFNNVVDITICKRLKRAQKYFWASKNEKWSWIPWSLSLDHYLQILLALFPILKEIWRRVFAKPQKVLWHCENAVLHTRTIFKSSHFVNCWLAFNRAS